MTSQTRRSMRYPKLQYWTWYPCVFFLILGSKFQNIFPTTVYCLYSYTVYSCWYVILYMDYYMDLSVSFSFFGSNMKQKHQSDTDLSWASRPMVAPKGGWTTAPLLAQWPPSRATFCLFHIFLWPPKKKTIDDQMIKIDVIINIL